MNINLQSNGFRNRFFGAMAAAILIFFADFATVCQAQPSPVDTWDCVLTGKRDGTAYLTFFDDGTFSGYEVMVPRNSTPNPGRGGVPTNRGGSSSPPSAKNPQIFGAEMPSGPWAVDSKGRRIGYFIEVSQLENCVTNAIPTDTNSAPSGFDPTPITNTSPSGLEFCVTAPVFTNVIGGLTNYTEQTICYTNIIVCQAITNAVSFVGKVTPGKRLTLVCSTPFGQTLYKGVPARNLSDISGSWSGTKKQSGTVYQEFFTLSPSSLPFPNVYSVLGSGPGYSYHGHAILSSQKKISFVLGIDPLIPTDPVTTIRAVTGPFNLKKGEATTQGWNQPSGEFTNAASFKAIRF